MASYIQTQYQQERLNRQVLSWVLPVSIRDHEEEVKENVESETESINGGAKWSSFYSLSSSTTKEISTPEFKADSVMPPPPLQPNFKKSKFGTKNNLDMCTETLGCETGTMYTTDDYKRDGLLSDMIIGFQTHDDEVEERMRRERKEMVERRIKRVKSTGTKFPPALTTRTRENFVQMVRERENGRMVMYALRQQSTVTAERKDGRLKLRLHDLSCSSDHETETLVDDGNKETTTPEEEEEEVEEGGGENGGEEMEGRKYVFAGRCKEEKKKECWRKPFMVASAI